MEGLMGLYIDIALGILIFWILCHWIRRGMAQMCCAWLNRLACPIGAVAISYFATASVAEMVGLADAFNGWATPLLGQVFDSAKSAELSQQLYLIAVGIVLFFVAIIVLIYLVKLVAHIFKNINKVQFFKICDKTLGAIFSLVISYIVIVVLLTGTELLMVYCFADKTAVVMQHVADSMILSTVHNTNFFGNLLADLLGVALPTI